jgi:16S rRNA (cytosine1402-N4)-methyltransferase
MPFSTPPDNQDRTYHKPVMLRACIEELNIQPSGTYVDVTFGGGGHSEIIHQLVPQGKLIAFDQDTDAYQNAVTWPTAHFQFVRANFRFLERYLDSYDAIPVDGILADLGISSWQIDEPGKGFSIRFDGPLDMRMNNTTGASAADVVNTYSPEELERILKNYAEVSNPRRVAHHLVAERARKPITTTGQLRESLWSLAPRNAEFKFLAQVFQGIRIEVNDEMNALKEMLLQTARVLRPGGRLVVLTYHSLEDRLVKDFMASGNFEGKVEKDIFGNPLNVPMVPLFKKAQVPSPEEIAENPRARSAKLRVAERVQERTGKVFPS